MSRGTIHHWFAAEAGSGAEVLSLLAAREACGTQGNLIVFDPDEAFYPPGAAGWGIDLNRTVVLRGGAVRDRAWAIDQALQCDAVAAVWGPLPAVDARWLRRFQLSAEQSGCIGLFVRPATAPRVPAWCETQWLCRGFAPRRGDSAPADSGSPFDRTIELQLLRAQGGLAGARFILRLDFQNGTVQWERRHEPAHLMPLARQLADPKTRRREPELRDRPIVLFQRHPQRGEWVSALSAAAAAQRVRVGMPLAEARTCSPTATPRSNSLLCGTPPRRSMLPRKKPSRLGEPCDPRRSTLRVEFLTIWLPIAGRCSGSPLRAKPSRLCAAIEAGESPESVMLDITGVAHLFGGEAELIAAVRRHVQRQGYTPRLAIADTLGAAWAMAHAASDTESIVPPGRPPVASTEGWTAPLPPVLLDLPLAALRLERSTEEVLGQLGIDRIGQLLRIPRGDLSVRFGGELLRRLDQAAGTLEEVAPWLPPPIDLDVRQFLDFPTTDRATLHVILARLIEQLCDQLRQRRRGGMVWEYRLFSPDDPPIERQIRLVRPAASPRDVMPLIDLQLEFQPSPRRRRGVRQDFSGRFPGIHQVRVHVSQSVELVDRQLRLFADDEGAAAAIPRRTAALRRTAIRATGAALKPQAVEPGSLTIRSPFEPSATAARASSPSSPSSRDVRDELPPLALAHLINRLSARLGTAAVVSARLQPEPLPEQACQWRPLIACESETPGAEAPRSERTSADVSRRSRRRVVTVAACPAAENPPGHGPLQRPLRLCEPERLQVLETSSEGAPAAVVCDHRRHRISAAWGPERLETGWWRGSMIRRDYWRVELDDGRWLWLFQQLGDSAWFLHGTF